MKQSPANPIHVYPVKSHFLDSGAFSLRKDRGERVDYDEYMGRYAKFVKGNTPAIDFYANVDVIDDPERSWEHQQILEKKRKLKPIPVIHYGSDLKWIEHYLERGYPFIAIGGMASNSLALDEPWLDEAFDLICSTPNRFPAVKVHGLGVGGHNLITKYPWYSLDTVRWCHLGVRAYIPIPPIKNREFDLSQPPRIVKAGNSPENFRNHITKLVGEKKKTEEWLRIIGVDPNRITGFDDSPALWCASYLHYFEALRKTLPFPRPFHAPRLGGFVAPKFRVRWESLPARKKGCLRIYYSGGGRQDACPETVLKEKACIMLSFYAIPKKRFAAILEARETGRPVIWKVDNERRRVKADATREQADGVSDEPVPGNPGGFR